MRISSVIFQEGELIIFNTVLHLNYKYTPRPHEDGYVIPEGICTENKEKWESGKQRWDAENARKLKYLAKQQLGGKVTLKAYCWDLLGVF